MTTFPTGFTWGAATSAHQIEGGNTNSDWWRLEHATPSLMTESSGDACDSDHRYGEDLDLLAAAGLTSYRFSVEWARIEPAPGEFSLAALDHYQRVIDACYDRGVEPLVTLHHFTNPHWLREIDNGWTGAAVVDRFRRYADVVLGRLTGLSRVCTINEPNMIATFAHVLTRGGLDGEPRPDPVICERLVAAHEHAVGATRAAGARAGITVAMTAYTTDGSEDAAAHVAALREWDEDVFLRADGDFVGVQAYTRRHATREQIFPHGEEPTGPSAHQTMMGWELYPQSAGDCLRRAHEVAPTQPLLVTENGIATADDDQRIAYLSGALRSVHEAVADGVPVEGYWHWSLLDNYEWVHGYRPTFGLIAVDRTTFERTPKPSLDWLGRVAKANALPD